MSETPDAPQRAPWWTPGRSRAVAAALAAVAALALVALVLELVLVRPAWSEAQEEDAARAGAVRAAERFTVQVNNYDASDLDTLKSDLSPMLTTKFRTDFEKIVDDLLTQMSAAKLSSEGKVIRSAVASADTDSAEVLVVADATATSVAGTYDRHFRWSVDLVKVDGEWLVDNFTPVA